MEILPGENLVESIEALRIIAAAQQKMLSIRKSYGLSFYTPHHKQELFHRAGDFDFRYARTGNRFGKSEMGSAEDVAHALGERPWFEQGDTDRTKGIAKHPTKGLIITTDWDKSREVFTEHEGGELGKLFKFLPNGCVKKVFKNSARAVERIVVGRKQGGGESVICIDTTASYKQNKMSQESSVWDWIHVDEPIPEGQWKAVSRGLADRCGKGWFTCTPLDQPWINRLFLPNQRHEVSGSYEQRLKLEGFDAEVTTWMMTGSMDDNPHNTEKAKAVALYAVRDDPEQMACRRFGLPLAMSGMVYKEFQPAEHIYHAPPPGWTAMDIPPRNWTIRLAIDPHPRIPTAVLMCATSPGGFTYFFKEIFRDALIPDVCDEILAVTKGYYIQDSIIDPLAKTRDPRDDSCMMDTFTQKGVWCVEATKAKFEGILEVRRLLRERNRSMPIVFFGAHLKRTLWEFDNWVYDPDTNKPVDKDDHMMENLYRLALTELEYVTPDGNVIKRKKEQDPEEYLSQALRTEEQRIEDFQELDLETDEWSERILSTADKEKLSEFQRKIKARDAALALARKSRRAKHGDAY